MAEDEKILLFTHGIDIDGYGCAILAKLVWGDKVDVIFADNYDLDDKFVHTWGETQFKDYSQIYVTDHCPTYALCNMIDRTPSLREKIKVLDHHDTRIGKQDKFDWVQIIDKNPNGMKECGTSLFYKYLVENDLLKETKALDEFVDLTRLFDTWTWKDSEKKDDAKMLDSFASVLNKEKYIEYMIDKVKNNSTFKFNNYEKAYLKNYMTVELPKKIDEYISKIQVVNFEGKKAGYVEVLDKFKNYIGERLKTLPLGEKLDFMLMPIQDRTTVSLRSIKEDCDVGAIASKFGGGGHKGAASIPKWNFMKIKNNVVKEH